MNDQKSRELNWAGEPMPTEAEQDRWSRITVAVSMLMGLIVFL